MHVVLVGPGALGGLLAVYLTPVLEHSGGRLSLLDHNPDRAAFLAANGITLLEDGGERHVRPRVHADITSLGRCDLVLLCIKSNDVAGALTYLQPLIHSDTLIVGLQNGMTHITLLEDCAGIPAAGVSALGASLAAPGTVFFGGHGPTRLGLLKDNRECAVLDTFIDLMQQSGLEAGISDNIRADLWNKLFVNVGINALTAIHNRKNGQLLTSCTLRSTMKNAIREAMTVAEKSGVPIMGDPIARTFAVCRRTRNNISSMLQDVRRQRPTEIMAINGFIVEQGRQLGIATPVNRELVKKVQAIEAFWTRHHA